MPEWSPSKNISLDDTDFILSLSLSLSLFKFQFAAMFRAAIAILNSRGTVYRFGPAAIAICKYTDMIFAQ